MRRTVRHTYISAGSSGLCDSASRKRAAKSFVPVCSFWAVSCAAQPQVQAACLPTVAPRAEDNACRFRSVRFRLGRVMILIRNFKTALIVALGGAVSSRLLAWLLPSRMLD